MKSKDFSLIKTRHGYYQVYPLPSEEELKHYYQEVYHKKNIPPAVKKLAEKDRKEINWLRETLWTDFYSLSSGKTLLDYGSGSGQFASFMRENGFQVDEYDLAFKGKMPDKKYDTITMINVLEHVPYPESTIRNIRKLLKQEHPLIIQVPNDFSYLQMQLVPEYGRYWIKYPDHLNYFSFESLYSLLEDNGFCVNKYLSRSDFPMELFLHQGFNYLKSSDIGAACHERRKKFEMQLDGKTRHHLYNSFLRAGLGRNIIVYATKI